MTDQKHSLYPKHLPTQLRWLVKYTINILGQQVKEVYGPKQYKLIEKIRLKMKESRNLNDEETKIILRKVYNQLNKENDKALYEITHTYSLYLELINRCEKAYRNFRLEQKHGQAGLILNRPKKSPHGIIYVFTAHPTEARSPEIMELLNQIEDSLTEILRYEKYKHITPKENDYLSYLINLCLRTSLSKNRGPTVQDEAWHIFSVVLAPEILQKQVELKKNDITVNFRTWVGGDKDGHPYVDEKTLQDSLQLSRGMIWNFVKDKLDTSLERLALIDDSKQLQEVKRTYEQVSKDFENLLMIKNKDGDKIAQFHKSLSKLLKSQRSVLKSDCPDLKDISTLLWLYPALVLPLELREDSEEVEAAIESKKSMPIEKMVLALRDISYGFNPKWYIRGLVISMTRTSSDIINGITLIKKSFNQKFVIPVVPLFETRQALEDSTQILKEVYEQEKWLKKHHQTNWDSRYEIMLGYSDSSKESGVLASRHLIADALTRLDSFFKKEKLTPVFFHGSGGSIERGGGSIKEQTSWWPKSALNVFKATVQGEMVSRSFSSALIMQGQVQKILDEVTPEDKKKAPKNVSRAIENFALNSAEKYSELIKSPSFIQVVQEATPYMYLDQLKIGSRPSKRQSNRKEIKLRAIPWVLCWTQTRILLPTWYGAGSAWKNLSLEDKYLLVAGLNKSEFLVSYAKILGFTLEKIDLAIFSLYLEMNLPKKDAEQFFKEIKKELELTKQFLSELTRREDALWFRPWLKDSIFMRSSMIHPLNLIQLIALERKNTKLLQESVTGVACGMLTTG